MEQYTQKRQALPDLLKGLAVLLMIQVHLSELFAIPSWVNTVAGKWSLFLGGPPAAPLFMVIMGYFLAMNKPSPAKSTKKGLQFLLWGLLLNTGLNMHLFILIATDQVQVNPLHYFLGVDILILAGFSVFILLGWSVIARTNVWLWSAALIFFAFGNSILPSANSQDHWLDYLLAAFNGTQPWAYFPVFPWASYPVAGYLFYLLTTKHLKKPFTEKSLMIVAGLLSIPVIAGFTFAFDVATNLPEYYHHNGVFVAWTLCFVALLVIVVHFLSENSTYSTQSKQLQWMGKNVTAMYVFQWLIIGNLATALYQSQFPLQIIFWFFTVSGLSVLLTLGWKTIKPVKKKVV